MSKYRRKKSARAAGIRALPQVFLCALTVAAVLVQLTILGSPKAQAGNLVGDAVGVVTDPFKIGKGSEELAAVAERTMIQLRELEKNTNLDIKDRLEQVRTIVADFDRSASLNIKAVDSLAQNAIAQLRSLESQSYGDAIKLLYRVQCVSEVVLMDQLQRSLAEVVKNIIAADPGVTILGVKVAGVDLKEITITDPDMAYRSVRETYERDLGGVKEDDDPYIFISRYQNVARLARLFACHYQDVDLGIQFVEQVNEYQRRTEPWIKIGAHL